MLVVEPRRLVAGAIEQRRRSAQGGEVRRMRERADAALGELADDLRCLGLTRPVSDAHVRPTFREQQRRRRADAA